ncbi:transporter [Thermococcus guaymasensis DSM 11113]|uniref:Transporter n=1 Tax=Thermococcus guaymasensis DSM 11113 TaxID=1432656 RepID=A0A0X1KI18_9EURY|nr:glycosyltransferase family 39 protein [Thermococcus guaymasensis]AJC70907.1 transporter [Thermococcus guaymasensis DSM 11113]
MRRLRSLISLELVWLLLIAFFINFSIIYGRKMPVGANGGDTVIHMGIIRGIYLGRNPFLDQHYNVPPNWYPFLYHLLIAALSKLTNISIWTLMIWTPLIFAMLMVTAWYFLGRELNKEYGGLLLGALSFLIMGSQLFPNPKALIPILLALLYLEIVKYLRKRKRKHAVYAGVLLGLMLWSHVGASFPVLAGVLLYALLKLKEDKNLLLIPLVAVVVISPYLINIALHVQPEATGMVEGLWLKELTLNRTWVRIKPPLWGFALLLTALVIAFRKKENEEFWKFMLVSISAMLLVNILPSILYSTMGLEIFPSRFAIPLRYSSVLLYFYAITELIRSAKVRKIVVYAIATILVLHGSLGFLHYNYTHISSKVTYKNFTELRDGYGGKYVTGLVKVSEWVNKNTQRDDYIIGHPYTLEWIAGFTGRPVVAVTFGHGNPFIDMEERREDIKRFFKDPQDRKEVVEKYGVRYAIVDPFVVRTYNVTVDSFSSDFRVVFEWGDFYVLEIQNSSLIFS